MLDVVATTPSSPLGACRLVTLDMAPRWQCGWICVARLRKKGAAGQLSFIRQTGGGFQTHTWPGSVRRCVKADFRLRSQNEGAGPHDGDRLRLLVAKQSHQWTGAGRGPDGRVAGCVGRNPHPSVRSVTTLLKLLAPLKLDGTLSRPVVASLIVLLSAVGDWQLKSIPTPTFVMALDL